MERLDLPIGIFDSGLGGLSVLRTALRMLPNERFIYYGDIANAPYGTKTEQQVRDCAAAVTQKLLSQGIKALVIACNTATCAAAEYLRARYPELIIIGMEPALKLAHDLCPSGPLLVMATPVTLSSSKYQRLAQSYGQRAVPLPCPGLMEYVEQGEIDTPAVRAYLMEKLAPFVSDGAAPAAVVLGCTHYVFLRKTIASLLPPSVRILDGNEGAVRHLSHCLSQAELLRSVPFEEHVHGKRAVTQLFNAPDPIVPALISAKLLQIPE